MTKELSIHEMINHEPANLSAGSEADEIAAEFETAETAEDLIKRLTEKNLAYVTPEESEELEKSANPYRREPSCKITPTRLGTAAHIVARFAVRAPKDRMRGPFDPQWLTMEDLDEENLSLEYREVVEPAEPISNEERLELWRMGQENREKFLKAAHGFERAVWKAQRLAFDPDEEPVFYGDGPQYYIDQPITRKNTGLRPDFLMAWGNGSNTTDRGVYILSAEFKYAPSFDVDYTLSQCAQYVDEYLKVNADNLKAAGAVIVKPILLAYDALNDRSYAVMPHKHPKMTQEHIFKFLAKARREVKGGFMHYGYRPEIYKHRENLC